MRILVDPTAAKDRESYASMAEAVRNRRRGVMLTTVHTETQTEATSQWFAQEAIPPDVVFPGAEKIRSCMARERPQLFLTPDGGASPTLQVLVEPVIPKPLLLVAGGGHIGQSLALQASLVGFDVTVIDDRAEFTDPALYPDGTVTR